MSTHHGRTHTYALWGIRALDLSFLFSSLMLSFVRLTRVIKFYPFPWFVFLSSVNNLPMAIIPFTGRSDYGPFIDEDVLIPGMYHTYWHKSTISGPFTSPLPPLTLYLCPPLIPLDLVPVSSSSTRYCLFLLFFPPLVLAIFSMFFHQGHLSGGPSSLPLPWLVIEGEVNLLSIL